MKEICLAGLPRPRALTSSQAISFDYTRRAAHTFLRRPQWRLLRHSPTNPPEKKLLDKVRESCSKLLITPPGVSTHLSPARKGRCRELNLAETPLSAISSHLESEESEGRLPLEAPHENDSSFRADLDQSTPDRKAFMKFVSLRTKYANQRSRVEKPSREPPQSFAKSTPASRRIHTYAELRQQIHDDLRLQHPDWIQPDGKSPMCDSYEARLMELLDRLTRSESNQSIVDPHRLLEQGAH